MRKNIQSFFSKGIATIALFLLGIYHSIAQSSAGIDQATSEVSSYIDPVANLIIAIGAVVGLIGGVRVYIKWQSGDQDTQKKSRAAEIAYFLPAVLRSCSVLPCPLNKTDITP